MGLEEKLLNKAGRDHGMRVPPEYFGNFTKQMMSKLPEYPQKPRPQMLGRWQRIKPYVYMAAMFAGIWCMMKMFHIASQNASSLDAPSEVVAALQVPEVYDYYSSDVSSSDISDFELEESVSESYDSMADFEADFGYELRPEYASIDVQG